jgi:hypothetical protein
MDVKQLLPSIIPSVISNIIIEYDDKCNYCGEHRVADVKGCDKLYDKLYDLLKSPTRYSMFTHMKIYIFYREFDMLIPVDYKKSYSHVPNVCPLCNIELTQSSESKWYCDSDNNCSFQIYASNEDSRVFLDFLSHESSK